MARVDGGDCGTTSTSNATNAATVNAARSAPIKVPVQLWASERGGDGVLPHDVAQADKNDGFLAFIQRRGVNVVILNWRLRHDTRFRDDPEFVRFDSAEHEADGFDLMAVPGTDVRVAVPVLRAPPGAEPGAVRVPLQPRRGGVPGRRLPGDVRAGQR